LPGVLTSTNALAGLMFMAVAVTGLWLSRDYPIGTALRMGTGYLPRLLCWGLLGLGAIIFTQGFLEARQMHSTAPHDTLFWRPLVFVTLSLVAFGLALERLGLVVSVLLLLGIGAFAGRGLRFVETAVAALVLIVLSWAIFILGLGLAIPVWPEW
jgi:putative tricarboxylic transport membrane protein